jgi:hypothetical protein
MVAENNEQSTEIATQGSFADVAALEVVKEALADDCGDLSLPIDRIKIPSGGSTQYELPSDDTDEVETVSEIKCVILHHHPAYAYYATKYEGGNNPPDCGSFDGALGVGTPGGECAKCPYNVFGSGEGQSKACKNRRMIYILREGDIFPMALSLPTGSLKTFTGYVKSQLTKGRRLNGIVTKLKLKKVTNNRGIAYSQAVFAFDRVLDDKEKAVISSLTEQMKEYAANLTPAALIPMDEEMVDPETGEVIAPLK